MGNRNAAEQHHNRDPATTGSQPTKPLGAMTTDRQQALVARLTTNADTATLQVAAFNSAI